MLEIVKKDVDRRKIYDITQDKKVKKIKKIKCKKIR